MRIGLYPKNAANRLATGGRAAALAASALGTPWAASPDWRAWGSVLARPRMMSEKKMPMESTIEEFWKVVSIPAPTPRRSGGRLFMTPARLGEEKTPMPSPMRRRRSPNARYEKSTGSSSSRPKLSAHTTIPPDANGRAPKRSERKPAAGPAMRNPAVKGSM